MSNLNILTLLAFSASLNLALSAEAQTKTRSSASDKRVEPFTRPAEMRIKPPADAPSGPNVRRATQACPATLDDMCSKFWGFAGYFLSKNMIPARDRELLTLRTAWLSRGEYIWGSHQDSYATKAGLTPAEVSRVTKGPDAEGWSRFDSALLRSVDELQTSRFISDETWKALGERYTDRQRLEVVMTVAAYTSLAMYFNSTGGQLEQGHRGFPE
jgi:4-carboxymuconolactone decarboxylase